jgi:3(or 17)beta-hydroxysteroid dehydrogenase
MAVNATGVFFGMKCAISAMVANGRGSIVNLSSIAGVIGSEHVHIAYNASKATVRVMTKWAAVKHAKDNIRANSVHPGVMPPMRTSDPAVRAERMRFIPMRRPGEVDEVAYAILFLASDESSYITGSEIHVDGGVLAI